MVLSDVNGGNGKKSAAERWLIQRNGQRVSAARCIFGPPEKRAHLMVLMRNEVEMDRKRAEFVARYEPVGLTPNERRKFYDGLVNTSSSPVPQNRQQQQQHRHQNNDHARNAKAAADHYQHNNYYHQQQKNNNHQPDDERN